MIKIINHRPFCTGQSTKKPLPPKAESKYIYPYEKNGDEEMKNEPQEPQEQMMPRRDKEGKLENMTENERLGIEDEHMIKVREKLDPWQGRSEGMICATCMWFVLKISIEGKGLIGRCRKHAPTMTGYPAVFSNDFCGDHKLDENKVKK